jgi:hypothetical protein
MSRRQAFERWVTYPIRPLNGAYGYPKKRRRDTGTAQLREVQPRAMYHPYFDFEFYSGRAWPDMPFGINGDFDHARLFGRVFARQKPRWVRPKRKADRPQGTPASVRLQSEFRHR